MRNPEFAAATIIRVAAIAPSSSGQTGDTGQDPKLSAAVLEFVDQWTQGATGAARMLERASMKVMPLDVNLRATWSKPENQNRLKRDVSGTPSLFYLPNRNGRSRAAQITVRAKPRTPAPPLRETRTAAVPP